MSMRRKRKSAANTLVFLLALVGALVLLNLLSAKHFGRLDLTEGNEYTLSDASVRLVNGLDRPLVVKAYFSPELQPPYHTLTQRVRDLLDEYRARSNGMLSFEVVNPEDTEAVKDEASGFGINPVRTGYRGATKVELRAVYKGVAFVHQDKQEVLSNLEPNTNLEYEFTRAIKKVTSEGDGGKKVLGFLGGHGELIDMEGVQRALSRVFEDRFEIKKVEVDDGSKVPDDVDALLVINPQNILPERTKFEIDQFLMRGKALGVFISTHAQDRRFPIPRAQPVITMLEPVLKHWGVTIKREVILDRKNNTQMLLRTIDGIAVVDNPVAFVTRDLSKDHIITKELDALSLPFSSPIEVSEALKKQEGASVDVLVRTMPEARARANLQDTSPDELFKEQSGETVGPFDVAVAVAGHFKSFYAEKDVPEPSGSAADGAGDREVVKESPKVDPRARLFVMANGEFLVQQYRMQPTSVIFLQNLVDWLVADEALIGIRSKGGPRPLDRIDDPGKRALLLYGNVLGAPALVVVFGLAYWAVRRRRRVTLWDDVPAEKEGDAK